MNKCEVQKRVLQIGKPLALDKFTWCTDTRTFSTNENYLFIDFFGISDCTLKTGGGCTFKTGSGCTFKAGDRCTFKTGSRCTFKTGGRCTFDTGGDCTFTTGSRCTFKTGNCCTFDTGSDCIFNTGNWCTFKTGSSCTFNTVGGCIFKTGDWCTFKTGVNCTFKTGAFCTFTTGWNCTFNTRGGCTFTTGEQCVCIRRDVYEVIEIPEGKKVQLFPYGKKGYLIDGMYNGKPHIIADGIVSEVIKQKGNVYHVKNLGDQNITYLVKEGDVYSHGETLKEARDSLVFKLKDRDTSAYDNLTLDTELTFEECVKMYRTITGACEGGTRYFVNQNKDKIKKKYKVSEIIEITKGADGNEELVRFIKQKGE